MNNKDILAKYIPMAEFISSILGSNCEVVIHDITSPNNSIIFIKNGHLSGRKLGGPLTDLVLNIIQNKSYKSKSFVSNYKAIGNFKTFRSASYFIKNDDDEIIGVLCVNIDTEPYDKVKQLMDNLSFISTDSINDKRKTLDTQEQFYDNVDELLYMMVQKAISKTKIPPDRMSSEEKINIVKELYDEGAFNLKGAVSEIAKALQVSEPTIYRYLNKYK
ncbi:transcriptional regulator [Clostridium neuense]|uniref:Transcriptional regulator n=1 Tax=Clostridium neuense TaxID=1728934 RepID=A0ABW8TLB5_9CLOT